MRCRRLSRTGVALGALSAACFVSVTSENLPVALLPELASGFGVSDSAIGLLVTWAAIGGACLDHGALPVAVATAAICGLAAVIVVRRSPAFSGSRPTKMPPTPTNRPEHPVR